MDYIQLLGFAAGTLGIISFLPQIIKIWKTKSSKDVSLVMFIIFCTATLLWIVYGVLINSTPVIITNVLIFIMALIILVLKFIYK